MNYIIIGDITVKKTNFVLKCGIIWFLCCCFIEKLFYINHHFSTLHRNYSYYKNVVGVQTGNQYNLVSDKLRVLWEDIIA
jgi:hypothetical protein